MSLAIITLALIALVTATRLESVGLRSHALIWKYMSLREKAYLMVLHVSKLPDLHEVLSSLRTQRGFSSKLETIDDIWRFNQPEFEIAFTGVNIFFIKSAVYRRSNEYQACIRSFIGIINADSTSSSFWRGLPMGLRPQYRQLFTQTDFGSTWWEYVGKKWNYELGLDQSSSSYWSWSHRIESGTRFSMVGKSIIVDLSTFEAVSINRGQFGELFWLPNSRLAIFVKRHFRDRRHKLLVYRADSMEPVTYPMPWRPSPAESIRVSGTDIIIKMDGVLKIPIDHRCEEHRISGDGANAIWAKAVTSRVRRVNKSCCILSLVFISHVSLVIVVVSLI